MTNEPKFDFSFNGGRLKDNDPLEGLGSKKHYNE